MEDNTDFTDPAVFARWVELATTSPKQFERERRKVVEELIAQAPESMRKDLRQLQSRIDATRTYDPLDSCTRVNQMMMDFVADADKGFLYATRLLYNVCDELAMDLLYAAHEMESSIGGKQNPELPSSTPFRGEASILSLIADAQVIPHRQSKT